MAEKVNGKSTLESIFTGTMLIVLMFASAAAQASSESSEMYSSRLFYVCPPEFIRLGSSCYYFSKDAVTWQDAHFSCKDRESHLTAPERWEDKHLREYLSKPEIEKHKRWIGGTYDYNTRSWKWGGEMKEMNYQSFAKMRRLEPEQLKWHCIAMIPEIEYRWDPMTCIGRNHYICQAKLRKVHKSERNRLRERWNPNGNGHKPNEIQVPTLTAHSPTFNKQEDNELRPEFHNRFNTDFNAIDVPQQINKHGNDGRQRINNNPKSYIFNNLRRRPNITDNNAYSYRPGKKVSNRPNMKKKKPFRGYKENKEDPESAYIHNVNALRSGRTGLSDAQVAKHLRRLERMRRKEMALQRQKERIRDRQNRERSIDGGQNENSNVLHDRILNIKNRNILDDNSPKKRNKNQKSKSRDKNNKKLTHSIDNVTQKTYIMNNQLSALHPKTIVEVHGVSSE